MTILDRIKTDHTAARKAGEKIKLRTLTTLFAEVEKVGKDKGNLATSDEQAIPVIKRFILNANECIAALRKELPQYIRDTPSNLWWDKPGEVPKWKASDMDIINISHIWAYQNEIEYCSAYLPKQMDEQKIRSEVALFLLANEGAKLPQVMKYFKEKFPGLYDGKTLSTIAKELTV